MNTGRTIFAQLMDFIPKYEFSKCIAKYKGNHRARRFRCWDQFSAMSFAQLSYRESLRDIEACLNAQPSKLYHLGIKGHVTISNLSRANEKRDWRIYAEFAQILISKAQPLYKDDPDFSIELDNLVYALDSTTINLCLNLFPWAKFRKRKGAIKLHTLLDLRGSIPTFIEITTALVHDINVLDILIAQPGAFYIMDRAYLDYRRLFQLNQQSAYFILRAKKNLKFRRLYSHKIDKSSGLRCDQTIRLTGENSLKHYPQKLRRVKFYDKTSGKHLVFLTNNFEIPALTVAELYRYRWKIELFFKWIKQHLKIKAFFGTSENAVKTQIWIAISIYILIAIVKMRLKLDQSLYTILQILSVSLFEKVPIYQLLTETYSLQITNDISNKLNLFNF